MIEARDLTKRYGDKLAVDHLSFTVEPGRVTGFLGPNGAGKSTTMRLILGLDRPALRHRDDQRQAVRRPRPAAAHGRRAARGPGHAHRPQRLQPPALPGPDPGPARGPGWTRSSASSGSPRWRASGPAVSRWAWASGSASPWPCSAIPQVLMLDEPVNGLDPEGILWIRNLMKQLASEGRTVFVSSHLMNEMAVTADHLIVIGRGKLIAETSTQEFIERSSEKYVLVRSPDAAAAGRPDRRGRRQGRAGEHGRTATTARGAAGQQPGRAADRRDRRGRPHRAARTHPAARLAGGGVHGTDRGQPRIRAAQPPGSRAPAGPASG